MNNTKKEKWVLPTITIKLIRDLLDTKTESPDSFKKKRDYSKTRESWPAAIFILRKILIEGNLWYLRKNDIEDSPDDVYARTFEFRENVIYGGPVLPIQVMRIMETSPNKLADAIKNKFTDDLKGVSLVCHFLRDEDIKWKEINKEIKKLSPNLNDITLVGNIGGNKFIVGQIFPTIVVTVVNLDLIQINAPTMLESEEVLKAKDTELTKLGDALLTTRMDIIPIE